jgi:hypothetical protein
MTLKRLVALTLVLYITAFVLAVPAFAQRRITTTLLPVKAESTPGGAGDTLKISANGSDPIQSTSSAILTFDPRGIPQQATITNATLRLVGKTNTSNPQLVRVTVEGQQDSIGQWTAVPGGSVFSASSDSLRQVIATRVQGQQTIALRLISKSRLSDWDYYALSDTAYPSSSKPRLIVEYELPATLDVPFEPYAPTRTAWRFSPAPTQVKIKPFFNKVTIISNPAFYQGDMYLFGKPTSQETLLYDLSSGGVVRWSTPIPVVPGSYALATETGRLYSLGENRIVLYDLEKQGAKLKGVDFQDLKLSVPPTLGADSSLYFVRSGYGYVYGLNPDQQEIWRYPAEERTGAATISRITLSPDAQRYAYTLTRRDNKNALVRINAADGNAEPATLSDKFTEFHRPIVAKGPEQDYVVVGAYSQSDGTLSVYSGGEVRWEKQGPVSQPIVDRDGKRVFAVQNGRLQAYDILNGDVVCTSAETALEATSNLVLDGEENVYFWNNGTLLCYRNSCQALFRQPLGNLPKDLELLFAPDGTLYARTATQQLFSLTPLANQGELILEQAQVQTNTIYSADAVRVANNVRVSKEMRLVLKADKTISFNPGFSVEQGARLRCQIRF